MGRWTVRDLGIQFERVVKLGWLVIFEEAGRDYDFDVAVLMGIGSRETNLDPRYQEVRGDGGHGHSIMQIDDRSYPEFCKSDDWKDVRNAVRKGAEVLEEKRKSIRLAKGIAVTDEVRLAIAAYNCGASRVIRNYRSGRSVDGSTTGKDYSSDVLKRAGYFRERIEKMVGRG